MHESKRSMLKWCVLTCVSHADALRVTVNTEATAANPGAPSTVTAATPGMAGPPVTAVRASSSIAFSTLTVTHTLTYTDLFTEVVDDACMVQIMQQCFSFFDQHEIRMQSNSSSSSPHSVTLFSQSLQG